MLDGMETFKIINIDARLYMYFFDKLNNNDSTNELFNMSVRP